MAHVRVALPLAPTRQAVHPLADTARGVRDSLLAIAWSLWHAREVVQKGQLMQRLYRQAAQCEVQDPARAAALRVQAARLLVD